MANVDVSYKGQIIATVNNGEEKILKTAGKYCEDNISLQLVGEEISNEDCITWETINENGEVVAARLYGPKSVRTRQYQQRNSLETVILGEGITSIGDYAFSTCTKLTSITLPSTIKSIGKRAFIDCPLAEITFKGTPDNISSDTFSNSVAVINVPWSKGQVAWAPWGASKATINYNYTGEKN